MHFVDDDLQICYFILLFWSLCRCVCVFFSLSRPTQSFHTFNFHKPFIFIFRWSCNEYVPTENWSNESRYHSHRWHRNWSETTGELFNLSITGKIHLTTNTIHYAMLCYAISNRNAKKSEKINGGVVLQRIYDIRMIFAHKNFSISWPKTWILFCEKKSRNSRKFSINLLAYLVLLFVWQRQAICNLMISKCWVKENVTALA